MSNSNDFAIALRVLKEWCKMPLPQYTVMGFLEYCEKNIKEKDDAKIASETVLDNFKNLINSKIEAEHTCSCSPRFYDSARFIDDGTGIEMRIDANHPNDIVDTKWTWKEIEDIQNNTVIGTVIEMREVQSNYLQNFSDCADPQSIQHLLFDTKNKLSNIRYRVQADHPILARPDKVVSAVELESYKAGLVLAGYENIHVNIIAPCGSCYYECDPRGCAERKKDDYSCYEYSE